MALDAAMQAAFDYMMSDEGVADFEARLKAQQQEQQDKQDALKASGKYDEILKWVREYFAANPNKSVLWDESVGYRQTPDQYPFTYEEYCTACDIFTDGCTEEDIEGAMFETYMWTNGDLTVESMSGQGTITGFMPTSQKQERIEWITRDVNFEEE